MAAVDMKFAWRIIADQGKAIKAALALKGAGCDDNSITAHGIYIFPLADLAKQVTLGAMGSAVTMTSEALHTDAQRQQAYSQAFKAANADGNFGRGGYQGPAPDVIPEGFDYPSKLEGNIQAYLLDALAGGNTRLREQFHLVQVGSYPLKEGELIVCGQHLEEAGFTFKKDQAVQPVIE